MISPQKGLFLLETLETSASPKGFRAFENAIMEGEDKY
jgi:hypothetical protein